MTLSGVYGFWKYVSNLERRETRRYLEMFYALKYRNLVSQPPFLDCKKESITAIHATNRIDEP